VFLNTKQENVAFTSGTTDSINLVASGYLLPKLDQNTNVVTTIFEHHSNLVPWQMACKQSGAELRVAPATPDGQLDLPALFNLIDDQTKLVACTHISNALGTVMPVKEIISFARGKNIPILIDAAQSAGTYKLDLAELDCDFLCFSAHKAFGPLGVGILYANDRVKDQIKPVKYGGGMVKRVHLGESLFKEFPYFTDVGTVNIAGVLGWSSTIDFLNSIPRVEILQSLQDISGKMIAAMHEMQSISVIGFPSASICSFNVANVHSHDVATVLNDDHIAVRAGRHCCQPLMEYLDVNGTVRVSLSIYNTQEDIDQLLNSIMRTINLFHEN
jgi:cysteine desulfurase/selenocysteine lyase